MSSVELLLDPPLDSGQTVEFKIPIEELTPDPYTPTSRGIELEVDPEGVLSYIYYSPIATDITLDKDVLDISCGWQYININL